MADFWAFRAASRIIEREGMKMSVSRGALALDVDGLRERPRNERLRQAVHRHSVFSRAGLEERLFTFAFSGLVYSQIWEDPLIDLEAMDLKAGEHVVAIASGGCNVLSYVALKPVTVTAIDLNPAHVALNKLKLAAIANLPDAALLRRFVADADCEENLAIYECRLAPSLDSRSRAYWEGRDRLGRRRISYFTSNVYRHGLLGWFIGAGHLAARLHGVDPRRLLKAKSRAEQRAMFQAEIAPLFAKPHIRWLMAKPSALFGLGIPPSQFEALKGNTAHMADVLRARLERLICGFDFADNYFAWQAFGRSYGSSARAPLPPYLQPRNFTDLKSRVQNGAIDVVNASFTEHLAGRPGASVDAFVLLDAQDWMTDAQLTALWAEIARTSRRGARVIFRTAGEHTILPGRIPAGILSRFTYDATACREKTARDRSSIYGGFHAYVFVG